MNIRKKQLVALFICSLVPWILGNGLLPLLPVYATQLGASTAVVGYSLSISYLALALGALSAGWVSGGLHRRKLPLIISGLVSIPTVWFMSQVHTVLGLTVLTVCLWFLGGLGLALISILAGLSSGQKERGKIFGILALTGGLGALVGSLGSGWIVGRWGYTVMFNILTIVVAFWPLTALLLKDKEGKQPVEDRVQSQATPGLGKSFYLLFTASIFSAIAGFFIILIRSILMNSLKFTPLEITSTGAIGGLVGMPFPLLMGWLSDRMGRKTFLITGYVATLGSLILLAFSKTLWNFWTVFAFQGIAMGGAGLGNALVTDLVPEESLGNGLAIFGSSGWIGGVIGFAAAGYLLQFLGFGTTFVIGGCLALIAVGLLVPVQVRRKIREPNPTLP